MNSQAPKLNVFVLMPFNEDFDDIFENLILPVFEENGFEVARADLSINQQQILKDIVNQISKADLIVADVSGLNGNVMYELGLAHGMGRRTVIITQNIDELPFDLRSYRANSYSTRFTEVGKLKVRLEEIAKGVVNRSITFGNPVQDFAPEFLIQPESASNASRFKVANADDSFIPPNNTNDDGDYGILDYSVELAESTKDINEISETITEAVAVIGKKIEERTGQINLIKANFGDNSSISLQMLMREIAVDYETFSEVLAQNNPRFGDALSRMSQSTNGIARLSNFRGVEEREQAAKDIEFLRTTELLYEEVYNSTTGFSKTISELAPMEKSLTRALRRAISLLNENAEYVNSTRSEIARTRSLLEDRLNTE